MNSLDSLFASIASAGFAVQTVYELYGGRWTVALCTKDRRELAFGRGASLIEAGQAAYCAIAAKAVERREEPRLRRI